jgi:hypothetical protein
MMADWQVEFAIVPRRALAGSPRRTLAEVMDANWWATGALPADYASKLTAIALSAPSTSAPEVQTWGEAEGNRVDVRFENGRVSRVTARVDVRKLDARFGAMLLQFARVADAVLIRRDGLVIEPMAGAFGAALKTSEAWRYANDTGAFMARYSDEEDE